MNTLKTLLIVGALAFTASAANAQSSFELSKLEMDTDHVESKYIKKPHTGPSEVGVIPQTQLAENSNQNKNQNDKVLTEQQLFEYKLTALMIKWFY